MATHVFGQVLLTPEQQAACPPGAEMFMAELPDGRLNVLRWHDAQGWHLNIAHVLATLSDRGEPRAGRIVRLDEIRAAQQQLVTPDIAFGLVFPPFGIAAAQPPGQVVALGEISFKAATQPQPKRNLSIIQ